MKLVFVTGMSGAGKSTTLNMMEDMGFYCVDNIPADLIEQAVLDFRKDNLDLPGIAVGVDIRTKGFEMLIPLIDTLREKEDNVKILFLDAAAPTIVRRYKETRRLHPLSRGGDILEGIKEERKAMQAIRDEADYLIDTSQLLTRELKQELERIFEQGEGFQNLFVTIRSFGFKYGIPADADLVFDVRFLPNPFYVPELKHLTGNDAAVSDYVCGFKITDDFLEKVTDMLMFLLPNYVKEGKTSLVVAFGCTGGHHRSVTIANKVYEALSKAPYGLKLEHRDIGR
ncbi:MAG: RNase adapter RapZ [Lachnospiraceae bacterium]|jgi:UPF0042 nucleotide-binding protein